MGLLDVMKRFDVVKEPRKSKFITTDEPCMEDFFVTTLEDYNEFDQQSWNKGEGYKLPNFPTVEEKLEGLDEGLYLLASESNMGKSAAMLNMIFDACTYKPNKLFGIYYSLDDSKYDIIPRVVAMDQSIPISVASKPKRYENLISSGAENSAYFQDLLDKRSIGMQHLKDLNDCFKIEDGNKIKYAEDIIEHLKRLQVYIKAVDLDANIIVGIDAVDDIRFSKKNFNTTTDRHSETARVIKEWSTELHIPIFGSRHMSKLKNNRRPVVDDLKDSNEYVYEASVVWLLYNDVSKNKQAANIYNTEDGLEGKQPIIEMDWAKNKKSSYKGRTYNYFTPDYSKLTECSEDVMRRFDALIYST